MVKYEEKFYSFLNGDTSIIDFEKFIYSKSNLELQLNEKIFFELISFNYKNDIGILSNYIKQNIIDESYFETWKLKRLLGSFIEDSKQLHTYLEKFYHLYCGIILDSGFRKYEFKFLGNLGLNYLYWFNEDYLKAVYGDNWEIEYKKCSDNFDFYHRQLTPFAKDILNAINTEQIIIQNDGKYFISEKLKFKFEVENIYKLKHPK